MSPLQPPQFLKPASLLLSLGITLWTWPAIAQFIPPPTIGKPGNRVGAGTRPGSCISNPQQPNLTALVPVSGMGLTTTAYPTFFWFMPANSGDAVRFTLYELDQDQADRAQVYRAVFKSSGEPGIASLTLPAQTSLPPLEVGKTYRWHAALICEAEDLAESEEVPGADGWIRRVEIGPALDTQLETAAPRDRFLLFAQAGLWQDALATLAAARRNDPTNARLAEDWTDLLTSAPVELDAIAEQPLLNLAPLEQAEPTLSP